MIRSPRRSAGRSRIVLAALVAGAGVLLAGCHAGQQAQTAEQRATIDGADADVGSIALRDVAIEYPAGGRYKEGADGRLRVVIINQGPVADALVEVRTDAAERVTFSAGSGEAGSPGSPAAGTTEAGTGTPGGTPTATGTEPAPETSPPPGTHSPGTPSPGTQSPGTQSPGTRSPGAASPATTARIEIPANSAVRFGEDGPTITLVGLTRELRATEVVEMTFVFERAGTVTFDVAVAVPISHIPPAPTVGTEEGHE